jgi:hypothetical protein
MEKQQNFYSLHPLEVGLVEHGPELHAQRVERRALGLLLLGVQAVVQEDELGAGVVGPDLVAKVISREGAVKKKKRLSRGNGEKRMNKR